MMSLEQTGHGVTHLPNFHTANKHSAMHVSDFQEPDCHGITDVSHFMPDGGF
jgi:hypothetical protein